MLQLRNTQLTGETSRLRREMETQATEIVTLNKKAVLAKEEYQQLAQENKKLADANKKSAGLMPQIMEMAINLQQELEKESDKNTQLMDENDQLEDR